MLDMTAGAILEAVTGMQAAICPYAIPQGSMTVETFAAADFLPGLVASLAVFQTFEERM
jgi:hypothetical protein